MSYEKSAHVFCTSYLARDSYYKEVKIKDISAYVLIVHMCVVELCDYVVFIVIVICCYAFTTLIKYRIILTFFKILGNWKYTCFLKACIWRRVHMFGWIWWEASNTHVSGTGSRAHMFLEDVHMYIQHDTFVFESYFIWYHILCIIFMFLICHKSRGHMYNFLMFLVLNLKV